MLQCAPTAVDERQLEDGDDVDRMRSRNGRFNNLDELLRLEHYPTQEVQLYLVIRQTLQPLRAARNGLNRL